MRDCGWKWNMFELIGHILRKHRNDFENQDSWRRGCPRSISDVVPLYKRRTTTQIYLSQSWDKAIHRNSHWMEETINFLSSSHKTPINHHSQVHFCSQSNSHFTNRKSRSKEIQPPICKGKIPIIQPSQNKNDCRVV